MRIRELANPSACYSLRMTFSSDLNPEQRAAVLHENGPMRIIAGAGTGKTQTLTRRFIHLVESGIREDRILCLTFSRKASRELERRILDHFTQGYRRLWVRTFHSFCLSLVEEWALAAQQPAVRVVEGGELEAFIAEVVSAIPDDKLLAHAGTFGRQKLASNVRTFGSQARDQLMSPDDIDAYVRHVEPTPGRLHDLALAHRSVIDAQRARGFFDFASMGFEVVARLQTDSALLEQTRARFDHILVDEFQDTNFAQFRLIQLLAGNSGNVCVVGDGNQAIYAFRGGQSRYISEFNEHFPGAATYMLGTNYRSGQLILDAANALIRHNPGADHFDLRSSDSGKRAIVTVTSAANPQLEAAHIVRAILEITRRSESPVLFTDIAIILRSVERNRQPIERALAAHGIPFRSGDERGGDAEAIGDVLAALRLIADPQRWTDAAWLKAKTGDALAFAMRSIEQRVPDRDAQDALLQPGEESRYHFTAEQTNAILVCQEIGTRCRQYAALPVPEALYKAMVISGRLREGVDPATASALRSFLDQATGLADAGGS
ncbi:MAG: ATP-dependent helicase, partial [Thermomicrobiales bacterium]